MQVKLISIGITNNDAIGKYVRHTANNIFLEVDSVEYKFKNDGKQVGYYSKNGNKGYWKILTSDFNGLKMFLKPIDINDDNEAVIKN